MLHLEGTVRAGLPQAHKAVGVSALHPQVRLCLEANTPYAGLTVQAQCLANGAFAFCLLPAKARPEDNQ